MSEKISLNKAFFGVKVFSLSYTNNGRKLETYNLFDFAKVKWSVAKYVTMTNEEKKYLLSDPLYFCFGDVWSRCQYEFLIKPMVGGSEEEIKTDVFKLYVEPNAEYLMKIVDSISVSSAKKYLSEERKRRKGLI